MANPNIQQGTLNRLIASVVIPNFPELNVTASFLGEEGIGDAKQGETTTYINTMTGAVSSPEPYQGVVISIHLLKTQPIAAQYKAQMESDSRVGDITVIPDSRALPDYNYVNCSIQNIAELRYNGKDAGFRITLFGYYQINNDLWDE